MINSGHFKTAVDIGDISSKFCRKKDGGSKLIIQNATLKNRRGVALFFIL